MPSTEQAAQQRREECRLEVLRYLVERQALAFPAHAIRRKLRMDGSDFEDAEIEAALEFLLGFTPDPLIKVIHEKLGATKNYQATTAGILAHERRG